MAKEKEKTPATERFFLSLENPEHDIEYNGFTFTVKAASLADEALVSLKAYSIMRELFSKEELKRFVSADKQAVEDNELEEIITSRAAYNLLPAAVTNFLEAVAYLDTVITKITKDGKPVVVGLQDGGEKEINSFTDFMKYVSPIVIKDHVFSFVNSLIALVDKWIYAQEIKPSEVKNS